MNRTRHRLEFDVDEPDLATALAEARKIAHAYFGDDAYTLRSEAEVGDRQMCGAVDSYRVRFEAIRTEGEGPLAKLRALTDDDVAIGERAHQAALLEASGAQSEHVAILLKVVTSARLTGEDLAQFQRHGIDVQPALDYVHRYYRPMEYQ